MDLTTNITQLRLGGLNPAAGLDVAPAADAAGKMEEVFATLLVKEMRRSLPVGFFGGGSAGDVYSGWMDEQVGRSLAERDALHMEEMLRASILQKQTAANLATAQVEVPQ